MSTSDTLLEVRNLTKSFSRRGSLRTSTLVAVNNVSFDLRRSEALGIVGESGSGKSTTARCILQLERPDRGSVVFDGRDLGRITRRELRHTRARMQLIFQHPVASISPRFRLWQAVEEPLRAAGLAKDARNARIGEVLALVGLEREGERYVWQLSGGQAQRAAIARALAPRPLLLICDEATSSLDVSVQAQILNLLRDLRESLSLALLVISHDVSVVNALTDRVLVMRSGEVVEAGGTREVLNHPKAEYTSQLMDAARALGHWQ